MGPKWTCATSASWEVETPTPLILGRPTWPLLPSGLPSPPWLQTSMGIAPPMLHHGSNGVASKLFAPKPVWRQQLLSMGFRVPNAPSNPSS